jgi:hypothetical protein
VVEVRFGFLQIYWSFFMFIQLDIPELVCLIIHSREDEVKNNAIEALVIHPNLTPDILCFLLYTFYQQGETDHHCTQTLLLEAPQLVRKINNELIKHPNVSAVHLISAIKSSIYLELRVELAEALIACKELTHEQLYYLATINYSDESLTKKFEKAFLNKTDIDSEFLCLAVKCFRNYTYRLLALSKLAGRSDVSIPYLEEILNGQFTSDVMKQEACDVLFRHRFTSTKELAKIITVKENSVVATAARLRLGNREHQLVLLHLSCNQRYLGESNKVVVSFLLGNLDIPELCCLIITNASDVRDICFDILLTKPDLNCEVLCHIIDSLRPVSFDKGMTPYLHIKILTALASSPSVTAKQLYFAMERSQDEAQIWIQRLLIDHPDVEAQMLYDISEEYDTDFDTMLLARQAFLRHVNVDEYLVRLAMRDWYRYDEEQKQAKIKYATHPDAILSQLVYQLYFSGSHEVQKSLIEGILKHPLCSTTELVKISELDDTEFAAIAKQLLNEFKHQFVISQLPKLNLHLES